MRFVHYVCFVSHVFADCVLAPSFLTSFHLRLCISSSSPDRIAFAVNEVHYHAKMYRFQQSCYVRLFCCQITQLFIDVMALPSPIWTGALKNNTSFKSFKFPWCLVFLAYWQTGLHLQFWIIYIYLSLGFCLNIYNVGSNLSASWMRFLDT